MSLEVESVCRADSEAKSNESQSVIRRSLEARTL